MGVGVGVAMRVACSGSGGAKVGSQGRKPLERKRPALRGFLFEDAVVQGLTPLATDRRPFGTCIWHPKVSATRKSSGWVLK